MNVASVRVRVLGTEIDDVGVRVEIRPRSGRRVVVV